MKSDQRTLIGNESIKYHMLKELNKPKIFESFLYVRLIFPAESIKFAFEGYRRAAPFSERSLYRQLNDVSLVAFCSSTDYSQNRKVLKFKKRN
jgi:beta-mannosidase